MTLNNKIYVKIIMQNNDIIMSYILHYIHLIYIPPIPDTLTGIDNNNLHLCRLLIVHRFLLHYFSQRLRLGDSSLCIFSFLKSSLS